MKFDDKIWFEVVNNKKIFCVSAEPKKNQKRMVIMSHGFRGSSIGPAREFVDFGRLLVENGFSVLRFDQPNGGNSEGDYVDSSFNEWVATTKYLSLKYIDLGYKIALLGQSMGGATSVAASTESELKEKIECLLLWSPGDYDPMYNVNPEDTYEENGQIYKGKFWHEVGDFKIKERLKWFNGGIHLVFGETDKFVSELSRKEFRDIVESKKEDFMLLLGQGHSSWEYKWAQKVYQEEIKKLKKYF
jgi:esterase/lipase